MLEFYQVCSNNDPCLTLKYLMARSSLVPCDFVWEKVKTIDFSETIVVKVHRRSNLNEFVNLYEYQGQGHSLTLVQVHSDSTFSNSFL